MRSISVIALLGLMVLGCNFSTGNNNNNGNGNNGNDSSKNSGGSSSAKGDFSTPKAALETFFRAGANRDAELLSQCFDPSGPGEFRAYREKTATAKQMDQMAEFVQGAEFLSAEERGDEALAQVKFKERDEKIKMKRTDGRWRIVDF